MTQNEQDLAKRIAKLPPGSLGKKRVNGHVYWYHRWQEEGKRREKYVPNEEVEALRAQIEERKSLESAMKAIRRGVAGPTTASSSQEALAFRTNTLVGDALVRYARGVTGLRHRACFEHLWEYLAGPRQDKVLVLYGLRRTGKTTLIRQALLKLGEEAQHRCAFMQVTPRDTLADVNADLKTLQQMGYDTVFLDEATLLDDFIEGAALFSDVFAASGIKVVLSGTDSLEFLFAQDEQLYDRCILLHTTFIPYGEFSRVLGIYSVDDYIRYGGTMSMGGRNYNESSTFANAKRAGEYVDSAIAHNIQHSLRLYQYGGHFRALLELYEADELTNAINRVVEDVNHRFAVETLTRAFRSHDLGATARNLRNDRKSPTDVLDRIDVAAVTARLAATLDIISSDEQLVRITQAHVREIREYLDLLEVTHSIEVVDMSDVGTVRQHVVVAQPGLRWAQVDALVQSLVLDRTFANLSIIERNRVLSRMRSEVMGRMLEDIVLLETKLARRGCQVFKAQFAIGEFDMVVADPQRMTCELFEVKHSAQRDPAQRRHLVDPGMCNAMEFRYGAIARRSVLYHGENCEVDGVSYLNVETYLRDLT